MLTATVNTIRSAPFSVRGGDGCGRRSHVLTTSPSRTVVVIMIAEGE